eukprot:TRINITY_DN7912_c2_g1_i1.p1 TRINITY_DN7912_c2_g1~~TRINITY_DN7912_c2_g1_i1.p1  ORF type:complete len:330 (-),score=37.25 TRINITY_DN7912_c2_g1_i1:28-993(-)
MEKWLLLLYMCANFRSTLAPDPLSLAEESDAVLEIREFTKPSCWNEFHTFSHCCGARMEGGSAECFYLPGQEAVGSYLQMERFRIAFSLAVAQGRSVFPGEINYQNCCLGNPLTDKKLNSIYSRYFLRSTAWITDISHHLQTLRVLASHCDSVTEVGVRSGVSSWAFLQGLVDRGVTAARTMTSIDLNYFEEAPLFEHFASQVGVRFRFIQKNVLKLKLQPTCLLFLDTFHAYPQLKRELAKTNNVSRYIVLHDTTVDGEHSECVRGNNCAEMQQMTGFDAKELELGLWPAIEEFLETNKDWELHQRFLFNNGLTVLRSRI